MKKSEPDRKLSCGPSSGGRRAEVPAGARLRLPGIVLAALVCLGGWGCGSAAEPSGSDPGSAEVQSMATSETGNPIEDLKRYMTPERAKLAGAGAVVLLVTFLIGLGVGKSRKQPSVS